MSEVLHAGAAERVITPPVGAVMVGWATRAAGDALARAVRDDLHAKALVLRRGDESWALLATDLVGVDAVSVAQIREGAAARTGLPAEAILVSATHCHSGPAICPVGSASSRQDLTQGTVQADGSLASSYGQASATVVSEVFFKGDTNEDWKQGFIQQAIEAVVEAWNQMKPAAVGFGQAEVDGVASSRRVLLSDGSWADPRRDMPPEAKVVSRTEIDPLVRVMRVRDQETQVPLAAVVNYGSHPWIFSISEYSAELPGATAQKVAARWRSPEAEPPIVLHTAGPEGDVTLIWSVDVENVWKAHPGEDAQQSLARRARGYDTELERLSTRLSNGVMEAITSNGDWDAEPELQTRRREVLLPLKPGYKPDPCILMAPWQKAAPEGTHRTEIQLLRVGEGAFLALPGEPLVSLGKAMRAHSPYRHLLITALSNDFGGVSYIATREEYELGGYELAHTGIAPGAGEELVRAAVALLNEA